MSKPKFRCMLGFQDFCLSAQLLKKFIQWQMQDFSVEETQEW